MGDVGVFGGMGGLELVDLELLWLLRAFEPPQTEKREDEEVVVVAVDGEDISSLKLELVLVLFECCDVVGIAG